MDKLAKKIRSIILSDMLNSAKSIYKMSEKAKVDIGYMPFIAIKETVEKIQRERLSMAEKAKKEWYMMSGRVRRANIKNKEEYMGKEYYVDLNLAIFESDRGKELRKSLDTETSILQKMIDNKEAELRAIDKETQEYEIKRAELNTVVSEANKTLQQRNQEIAQQLLNDIHKIINELGEKEEDVKIIDKKTAGILYISPSLDLTGSVIALYNEKIKGNDE